MCDPVTLAVTATAVAAAGAGFSAYMGVQQANYQKKVASANAKMESARAADELQKGQEDRRQLMRKYGALAGSQRASMAANGIDIGFGSAADQLGDTEMLYREDTANAIKNNAAAVKGIDISAANYTSQARAAGMAATGAAIGGAFDVGSTILGGVGKVNKIKAAQKAGGSGWGA